MKQKTMNISLITVSVCFALIVLAMSFDWATKYYVYLNQRDQLYILINNGSDIEPVKSTVSYLQGAATRQLNKLKDVSVVFGLVLTSFLIYTIKFKKGDKQCD